MNDTQYVTVLNNVVGMFCCALMAISIYLIPKPDDRRDAASLQYFRMAIVLWVTGYAMGSLQVLAPKWSQFTWLFILAANLIYMSSYYSILAAVAIRNGVEHIFVRLNYCIPLLLLTAIIVLWLKDDFKLRNTILPMLQLFLVALAFFINYRYCKSLHRGDTALNICLVMLIGNFIVNYLPAIHQDISKLELSVRLLLFILINGIVMTVTVFALFLNDIIERTRQSGFIDALSGLFNRKVFEYDKYFDLSKIYIGSVILCDIDHFKKINDTFGHYWGDEVIKSLSALLRTSAREQDRVIRMGGEEFALLLPGTSLSTATEIAQRLCIETAALNLSFGDVNIMFTASFGVSESHGQSLHSVIEDADKQLYIAKGQGRNRVAFQQLFAAESIDVSIDSA